jgi:hypothetical protein
MGNPPFGILVVNVVEVPCPAPFAVSEFPCDGFDPDAVLAPLPLGGFCPPKTGVIVAAFGICPDNAFAMELAVLPKPAAARFPSAITLFAMDPALDTVF